jgi:hypothetical protein
MIHLMVYILEVIFFPDKFTYYIFSYVLYSIHIHILFLFNRKQKNI